MSFLLLFQLIYSKFCASIDSVDRHNMTTEQALLYFHRGQKLTADVALHNFLHDFSENIWRFGNKVLTLHSQFGQERIYIAEW